MTISEKVAYLKGLAEGLGIDDGVKEGKMINEIIKVLEEVGHTLEDLETADAELGDEIDAVSDDLEDVEDIIFAEDEDEDDTDDDYFEVDCPSCGESLVIDEESLNDGFVICPKCGERYALDLSDEEDPADDAE